MVKGIASEVPPPGAGLITSTISEPSEVMSAAGTIAVNSVELTNVVGRADPPKLTMELVMKLDPLTVSVKAAPPAAVVFGEMVLTIGLGFDSAGGGVC